MTNDSSICVRQRLNSNGKTKEQVTNIAKCWQKLKLTAAAVQVTAFEFTVAVTSIIQ